MLDASVYGSPLCLYPRMFACPPALFPLSGRLCSSRVFFERTGAGIPSIGVSEAAPTINSSRRKCNEASRITPRRIGALE